MRSFSLFASGLLLWCVNAHANWTKINDADYVWGPFKIYNLSLYTETADYQPDTRPLMLTLTYAKPVDGRDFAISLARSWSNLGITLPNQEDVVDRLRKTLPDIKAGDRLSYIALPERGYFVLNDQIIEAEFNADFNQAVVAVWLDPRVEIGRKLLSKQPSQTIQMHAPRAMATQAVEPPTVSATTQPPAEKVEPSSDRATPPAPEEKRNAPSPSSPPKDDDEIEIFPPFDPLPASSFG